MICPCRLLFGFALIFVSLATASAGEHPLFRGVVHYCRGLSNYECDRAKRERIVKVTNTIRACERGVVRYCDILLQIKDLSDPVRAHVKQVRATAAARGGNSPITQFLRRNTTEAPPGAYVVPQVTVRSGIPPGVSAGYPAGLSTGYPENLRTGVPPNIRTGIPENVRTGAPARGGVPSNVKVGVPGNIRVGVPDNVRSGVQKGVTAGVPKEVKSGLPRGISSGTPEGVSTGIPKGINSGVPTAIAARVPGEEKARLPSGVSPEIPADVKSEMPASAALKPKPAAKIEGTSWGSLPLAGPATVPGSDARPGLQGDHLPISAQVAREVLPYAQMSRAVYEGTEQKDSGAVGYTYVADWKAVLSEGGVSDSMIKRYEDAGFSADIYRNSETNEIVIAYRGSEGNPLNTKSPDWVTNTRAITIQAPSDRLEEQYVAAASLATRTKQQYGPNVVLTGHSLGGGLASYAGSFGEFEVVTFNAARNAYSTRGVGSQQVNVFVPGDPVGDASRDSSWIPLGELPGESYLVQSSSDTSGILGKVERHKIKWHNWGLIRGSAQIVRIVLSFRHEPIVIRDACVRIFDTLFVRLYRHCPRGYAFAE